MQERDPESVGPHSSVIEFNRSEERQPYIFFRSEFRTLCDNDLAAQLDGGISIPMEKALRSFPNIRYYDAPPPIEELMKTLWVDSFHSRFDPAAIDPVTGTTAIPVTIGEITAELQQAYGSRALDCDARCVEFPRARWVREALEMFVALDMATSVGEGESFVVKYKIFPQNVDVLERLCHLTSAKTKGKRRDPDQLPLLPEG